MSVRDIARTWLFRPMVILICGKGDFAPLLDDGDFIEIIHARTRAELDTGLHRPFIDVAIVDDALWPGEDPVTLARTIRARGIGTVFAARTKQSGARLLRERMTVDVGAVRVRDALDNAVWIACCETELMRREAPEWYKEMTSALAPASMRFTTEEDGHLAPSESTMGYVFGDLGLHTPRIDGLRALAIPTTAGSSESWASENRRTVAMQPSASFLMSLRRARDQNPWWLRPLSWGVTLLGLAIAVLALVIFLAK